jgi:hypothetical protein
VSSQASWSSQIVNRLICALKFAVSSLERLGMHPAQRVASAALVQNPALSPALNTVQSTGQDVEPDVYEGLAPIDARDYMLAQNMLDCRDVMGARLLTFEGLEQRFGTDVAVHVMQELIPPRTSTITGLPPMVVIEEPRNR